MEVAFMVDPIDSRQEDGTARLIERARAGDATAFDQILVAHQGRVLALAWRLLGNADDARDAAQEVFLRVYRHLDRFDASRDFRGWLYRIAVNVCRDHARRHRGRFASYEAEREAGALPEPVSPHDTEAAAMAAEEQALLLRALARLSEKERAAIVLRDLEGLATEDVARILESSPTTVRAQCSTARAKLRAFREAWHRK